MRRPQSRIGRGIDNIRRNVLSYRYIKQNILMTGLVAVIAIFIFLVISFGENADPLADELYANDSVTVQSSTAVMMEQDSVKLVMDALSPADSYVYADNTDMVASSLSGIAFDESSSSDVDSLEGASEEGIDGENTPDVTEDTISSEDDQEFDFDSAQKVIVRYDDVYFMDAPVDGSGVISTVNANTTFALISEENGWFYVKDSNGTAGYLFGAYAEKE